MTRQRTSNLIWTNRIILTCWTLFIHLLTRSGWVTRFPVFQPSSPKEHVGCPWGHPFAFFCQHHPLLVVVVSISSTLLRFPSFFSSFRCVCEGSLCQSCASCSTSSFEVLNTFFGQDGDANGCPEACQPHGGVFVRAVCHAEKDERRQDLKRGGESRWECVHQGCDLVPTVVVFLFRSFRVRRLIS